MNHGKMCLVRPRGIVNWKQTIAKQGSLSYQAASNLHVVNRRCGKAAAHMSTKAKYRYYTADQILERLETAFYDPW
jgi:hypothetical protein